MAGGNYGGSSTPTVPISGDNIGDAAYKNYKCTGAYSTVASGAFTYQGVTFNFSTVGETLDLVMTPGGISSTDADVIFLCYPCGCQEIHMTGGSDTQVYSDYPAGTSPINIPTIIGGGGLNN